MYPGCPLMITGRGRTLGVAAVCDTEAFPVGNCLRVARLFRFAYGILCYFKRAHALQN